MKRAYLVNGYTISALSRKDNIIQVDSDTATYINSILVDDYCYVVLGGVEIVRVYSVVLPNSLVVARGIDSSPRSIWPTNTVVKYQVTRIEIQDAVSVIGNSISLSGVLTTDINGSIVYPEVHMLGIGGIDVDNSNIVHTIVDSTDLGCTSILGTQVVDIPLQYLNIRIERGDDSAGYRITDSGDYRVWE